MLIVTLALIATSLAATISEANLQRLRTSPQINFTYFFQYQYPAADKFEVELYFSKTGTNLTEILSEVRQIGLKVSAQAAKWNGSVLSHANDGLSGDVNVHLLLENNITVDSKIFVRLNQKPLLVEFLEVISKFDGVFISEIGQVREPLNFEIEDLKAKEAAVKHSKKVCQSFFGMQYQSINVFDKVKGAVGLNQSQIEQIRDGYWQILQQIEVQKWQKDIQVDQNTFFKCQIICRNENLKSRKLNSGPSAAKMKKIDRAEAEKIVQAKMGAKSTEKSLKKGKIEGAQPKLKRKNEDL